MNTLRLTIALIASGLLTSGLHAAECPTAKIPEQPQWVSDAYNTQAEGFLYGFAIAPYDATKSFDELLDRAAASARQELAKSIRVKLTSSISNKVSKNTRNGSVSVNQNLSVDESAVSDIELPGVPIKSQWQDPSTCDVYVLVEVSDELVELMGIKTQIDQHLGHVKDASLPFASRIAFINKSLSMLKKVELGDIPQSPTSEDYRFQFNHMKGLIIEEAKTSYLNGQYELARDITMSKSQRLSIIEETLASPFLSDNSQATRREKQRFASLRTAIENNEALPIYSDSDKQEKTMNTGFGPGDLDRIKRDGAKSLNQR